MTRRCPSPPCPVVGIEDVDLRRRVLARWPERTLLHRVGDARWPLDALNPSGAVGRFSPIEGRSHADVARRRTVALLETVFHDIGPEPADRRVYQDVALAGRHVGTVVTARPLRLVDLRDGALARLGIGRDRLVATSAAHHPCTTALLGRLVDWSPGGTAVDGAVWHSRVAEVGRAVGTDLADDLLHGDVAEVAVLYGRANTRLLRPAGTPVDLRPEPDLWPPLVDEVAELLGAELH